MDVESHGRDEFAEGIDLSGTIGWFTVIHPVLLDPHQVDRQAVIMGGPQITGIFKDIQEQLRGLPRGVTYGLLRYLNTDTSEKFRECCTPTIGFNYFGRFGARDGESALADNFGIKGRMGGNILAPHHLDINAMGVDVRNGCYLRTTWSWNPAYFTEKMVRALAEEWGLVVRGVVRYCGGVIDQGRSVNELATNMLGRGR